MGAGMQLREKSTLAYDELVVEGNGTGEMKTAMVVHGLMGSGRNWRTFSKRLATGMLNSTPGSAGELFSVLPSLNTKICCGECSNMVSG